MIFFAVSVQPARGTAGGSSTRTGLPATSPPSATRHPLRIARRKGTHPDILRTKSVPLRMAWSTCRSLASSARGPVRSQTLFTGPRLHIGPVRGRPKSRARRSGQGLWRRTRRRPTPSPGGPASISLIFNLCGGADLFLLSFCWLCCFLGCVHVVAGCGAGVLSARWPSGAGAGGFRCSGRGGCAGSRGGRGQE